MYKLPLLVTSPPSVAPLTVMSVAAKAVTAASWVFKSVVKLICAP